MGYVLLWVENLTASLLLAATLLACLGRIRRLWLSRVLCVVAFLMPMAVYAVPITWVSHLRSEGNPAVFGMIYPLLASAILYAIGGVWLLLPGLRREADSSVSIQAGNWSGGRLAFALAVVLVLHAMTFWSLDAAVKQQLVAVRAEAGALALSVAPLRVPDSRNAAMLYQDTFEAMDTDHWPAIWERAVAALGESQYAVSEEQEPADVVAETAFDYASAELEGFLAEHAGELAVIRKAAALPECRFERDYGRPSFEMLLPEQRKLRDAARLLALDARYKATKGDLSGALRNLNAIFAIGRHGASEPLIVCTLVSISVRRIGVDALETVLSSLPVTADDLDVLELSDSVSYRRLLARSFRMEEATGLSFFSAAEGGQLNTMLIEGFGFEGFHEIAGVPPLYRVFHLAEDLDSYRRCFRTYHMALASPLHLTRDKWQDVNGILKSEGAGMVANMILPGLSSAVEIAQRDQARQRAAVLGLAAYRYRAKHGRLPATLGDLSPEFINIVPRDPFDGERMRFKLAGQRCVFYSIGPDLADNGGSLLNPEERTGDIRFVVAPSPEITDQVRPREEDKLPVTSTIGDQL